ncbi:MAG: multiheme c-type cytochrome [Myxococcales bacterium]|nr:multiheme c-type cytochrome [Myxococcales bacterium]
MKGLGKYGGHGLLLATMAGALLVTHLHEKSRAAEGAARGRHQPELRSGDDYVTSRQCRACHLEHYRSWSHSYHRTMTQVASPGSVLGDFSGTRLHYGGQHYALSQRGDDFFMNVRNAGEEPKLGGRPPVPGLEPGEHRIAMVTGSHHMQVYWYETDRGRSMGQLPFAYLKREDRWVPRRSVFLRPPERPRPHETGRWNNTCVNCHATNPRPRLDAKEGDDTRVTELGIACEACHGPGREHVAKHTSPLSRYARHLSADADEPDRSIVDPRRLSHKRSSEICSQCHAMWQFNSGQDYNRWMKSGSAYRPGTDPNRHMYLFQPSRADDDGRIAKVVKANPSYTKGQYWGDGQARVSGREFNGLVDSACYQAGELSCLSCHTMHKAQDDDRSFEHWADDQLGAGMDGDGACLSCHRELGQSLEQHTFHPASSEGSRCYNCHMPYTSYGLLKAIRSHRVASPSVSETLEHGRPNACNLCHLDKSLGWTADALARRYGMPRPKLSEDDETLSAAVTMALKGDASQRALIAFALGWQPARAASGEDWIPAFLGLLMDDPYDAVRYVASDSLRQLPGFAHFDYDFVVPPGDRDRVAPRVAGHAGPPRALPPGVPLSTSGQLDHETLERLLSARDLRPINLLE